MRNQEVINNFFAGATKGQSSNGNLRIKAENGICHLINYSTVLAVINNKHLTLNLTKYSQTTTRIQNCILNSLKPYNFDKITELNNVERGIQTL